MSIKSNGDSTAPPDVVGPASSVDNAIARFDGLTGKIIQGSDITIADGGALGLPDDVRQTFNPGSTVPGLNIGSFAGDPSTPIDGDIWYNSSTDEIRARVNGITIVISTSVGAQAYTVGITVDGAGSVFSTGVKGYRSIPVTGTIQSARLLADQTGSVVIDVWKDTFANYPPTDADSITASAPPTISSDDNSEDTTLTGWTTSVTAGDVLGFNVDSVTDIQRVTLELEILP